MKRVLIAILLVFLISCTQSVEEQRTTSPSTVQEQGITSPSNQEPVQTIKAELQGALRTSGEISPQTFAEIEERVNKLEEQGYQVQEVRDLLSQFKVGGTQAPSSPSENQQSYGITQECEGKGPVTFTHAPMPLENIEIIEPIGLMIGGHVTPIDHGYYFAKGWTPRREDVSTFVDVIAPADGYVSVGSMPTEFSSSSVGDYRLVLYHTCTFYTIYIHVNQLSPALQKSLETKEEAFVKAGEVLGKAPGFDFSVHNEEVNLKGFIVPEHYNIEPFKIHTVDMFEHFAEPVKSQLLSKNVRLAEPRSGKIDYDIDGKLVGNWFEVGTNGYEGRKEYNRLPGYWSSHLAFAYDGIVPDTLVVSIGDFAGEALQFGVKSNSPQFTTISKESGLVKYELVKYEYITDTGSHWDRVHFAKVTSTEPSSVVDGTVLVQMLDDRKLKFEALPGKTASQVGEFTKNAKIYER